MTMGEDEAALAAQRAALTKKPQERASATIEKKRAAAAREGKNKFARSSVMKIKEVSLAGLRQSGFLPYYVCFATGSQPGKSYLLLAPEPMTRGGFVHIRLQDKIDPAGVKPWLSNL